MIKTKNKRINNKIKIEADCFITLFELESISSTESQNMKILPELCLKSMEILKHPISAYEVVFICGTKTSLVPVIQKHLWDLYEYDLVTVNKEFDKRALNNNFNYIAKNLYDFDFEQWIENNYDENNEDPQKKKINIIAKPMSEILNNQKFCYQFNITAKGIDALKTGKIEGYCEHNANFLSAYINCPEFAESLWSIELDGKVTGQKSNRKFLNESYYRLIESHILNGAETHRKEYSAIFETNNLTKIFEREIKQGKITLIFNTSGILSEILFPTTLDKKIKQDKQVKSFKDFMNDKFTLPESTFKEIEDQISKNYDLLEIQKKENGIWAITQPEIYEISEDLKGLITKNRSFLKIEESKTNFETHSTLHYSFNVIPDNDEIAEYLIIEMLKSYLTRNSLIVLNDLNQFLDKNMSDIDIINESQTFLTLSKNRILNNVKNQIIEVIYEEFYEKVLEFNPKFHELLNTIGIRFDASKILKNNKLSIKKLNKKYFVVYNATSEEIQRLEAKNFMKQQELKLNFSEKINIRIQILPLKKEKNWHEYIQKLLLEQSNDNSMLYFSTIPEKCNRLIAKFDDLRVKGFLDEESQEIYRNDLEIVSNLKLEEFESYLDKSHAKSVPIFESLSNELIRTIYETDEGILKVEGPFEVDKNENSCSLHFCFGLNPGNPSTKIITPKSNIEKVIWKCYNKNLSEISVDNPSGQPIKYMCKRIFINKNKPEKKIPFEKIADKLWEIFRINRIQESGLMLNEITTVFKNFINNYPDIASYQKDIRNWENEKGFKNFVHNKIQYDDEIKSNVLDYALLNEIQKINPKFQELKAGELFPVNKLTKIFGLLLSDDSLINTENIQVYPFTPKKSDLICNVKIRDENFTVHLIPSMTVKNGKIKSSSDLIFSKNFLAKWSQLKSKDKMESKEQLSSMIKESVKVLKNYYNELNRGHLISTKSLEKAFMSLVNKQGRSLDSTQDLESIIEDQLNSSDPYIMAMGYNSENLTYDNEENFVTISITNKKFKKIKKDPELIPHVSELHEIEINPDNKNPIKMQYGFNFSETNSKLITAFKYVSDVEPSLISEEIDEKKFNKFMKYISKNYQNLPWWPKIKKGFKNTEDLRKAINSTRNIFDQAKKN